MNNIRQRKRKILSVRLTDSELRELHQVMADQKMSASDLLREALLSFSRQASRNSETSAVTARAA